MRFWNLSQPSELNEVVVDDFPAEGLGRRRAMHPRSAKLDSLKLFAGVATLGLTMSFGSVTVNHASVRLPSFSIAISRTAADINPPLEGLFVGRFSSWWTEAEERSLIDQIVENRLTKSVASSPENIAPLICSNQQESISLENPRLSLDAVRQIVRKRKIS